jgi:hypothetical protein
MERTWPGATARARSQLARPTLYFEHERQVAFTGAPQGPGRLRYHEVAVAPHVAADFRRFAAAFRAGDALGLDGAALELYRAGIPQWRLERIEPAIGALFPFSDEDA